VDAIQGLGVFPLDVEAIASGLARLLLDDSLRAELGARGVAQAAGFTWEVAAGRLARAVEKVLESG